MRVTGTYRVKKTTAHECKNCRETHHEYYEGEAPEESECLSVDGGKHDWIEYSEIPRPER